MIQGKIPLYNGQFKKPEDKIKGDTHYIGILISNVWSELNNLKMERREREIEKRREEKKNIEYIKGDDFPIFVKNNLAVSEYSNVGFGIARGDDKNEIRGNYPDITNLNYIMDRLLYKADTNTRLCFLFEKWVALKLGVPKEKLNEVLGGTSDRPDLIWKNIIGSVFQFENTNNIKTKGGI